MTDMTYDPEADAIYIRIGKGKVDQTEEAGPFIYDLNADGQILGIEILFVSKMLAPGNWQKAPLPGTRSSDAAE
ncbi:DUF2283 domain-containing protein [Tardiphaga alba]|uniref:DUF2283 domain-containing protein n=1 Tax=Tardiphaga alba TaxID=340268 RepID=A0ABX8A3J1_9BRAD|nr:DUF2283 domain-containing protein [Tardiphaga alba]QUS38191.1 DUF2283 domain-containing protein [Tardiphaga alba]